MKISLKWLCDHIDVSDFFAKPEELAKRLTDVGLEVEAVENNSEQFKNVVVGEIVKLDRHPNADRLTVCQVNVGEAEPRQIVCGAKNHKAGDKVVVTLPGAVLPGNFEIKKSKIRNVESLGMLASESELGLKEESEGILVLPAEAPVGTPFAEYYGLDDVLFEINVSPNRADCLSHLGLARELSCILDRPLIAKAHTPQIANDLNTKERVRLDVRNSKLCPRYAGRFISGIQVGASPAWLKRRLESVGLNSINNVVDVTNFIMMDLGQPLHAFDSDQLKENTIVVDLASKGEKFKTLDGTDMELTGEELTIRDGVRAVCIAGVIGGENSGVTGATRNLFIESAHFAMDSVRKTARRHGLETDSAYRFSRGTDPGGVVRALERACYWIQQVAGGEVAADHWDFYPVPLVHKAIAISSDYVEQRLGYPVQPDDLKRWLERIGCRVNTNGNAGFNVVPPEFRVDLEQDVDLVEEFGRLQGYDLIPETLPNLSYAPLARDPVVDFESEVCELVRTSGFSQVVNYGFVSSKFQNQILNSTNVFKVCGLDMAKEPVRLQNPLNEELDVMRVSLIPGILKNILHNGRYGNALGRIFESGFTFKKDLDGYQQMARLALAVWGMETHLWQKSQSESFAFFDLKARLQNFMERLLIHQVQCRPWSDPPELFHPGQAATVFVEGRNIGFLGTLHPKLQMEYKLRMPVAICELDLDALRRGQPRTVKFKSISKFPAVERDLAFMLPKGMASSDVIQEIKRVAGPLLQSVEVFDVFEGGNLPEGHISVAYRLTIQDLEGTLNEERLTALQNQIVASVQKKLKITVR